MNRQNVYNRTTNTNIAASKHLNANTKSGIAYFLVLFLLCAGAFYSYPNIDIYISQLFFNQLDKKFIYGTGAFHYLSVFLFHFARVASCILIFLLFREIYIFFKTKSPRMLIIKRILYLIMVFEIGWFIIAHHVTKYIFHRPRPVHVIEFGGDSLFTKALEIGQCISQCSFVSGHAALGFSFYAFIFIMKSDKNKKRMFFLATLLGLSFGMVRVFMGMHFLSDIVLAGFLMFAISWLFYQIISIVFNMKWVARIGAKKKDDFI